MPRGQKTCPKCSATTGPRSSACPSCGHDFQIQRKAAAAPARSSAKSSPLASRASSVRATAVHSPNLFVITTPSGPPPCKPKGFKGQYQPTGSLSDYFPEGVNNATILDWLEEVKQKAEKPGVVMTAEAYEYWARYFFCIHDKAVFAKVRAVIAKFCGKVYEEAA